MSGEARRLWLRIVTGLALAAVLVWALTAFVLDRDRSASVEAAAAEGPPPDEVRIEVPAGLRGTAERVLLLTREPERSAVAPLVEILERGEIVVRRPAPPPDGPVPAPWPEAGIVLPSARLSELTPPQRAALLEIWSAFSGGDGLTEDALVGRGVELDGPLRRLLRWQR